MTDVSAEVERPANRMVVTLVAYLGLFLFAYTVPLAAPAKDAIAPSLGLKDAAETGPMFTTFFLSWLFIVPPGAYLADRFGRKALLMVGSATLTAGMLLLSAASSLKMACVAQFLNGGGAILLQIVGIAVVTDLYADKRGSSLSLAVGIVGMIALLSPMLMGELLTRGIAWSSVYRYSAALPAAAFLLQAFSVFPRGAHGDRITLRVVGDLLRSPLFLLLIFSMLVYGIVEQAIPTWSPDYLKAELGASVRWGGLIASGYWVIMSLARLIVGGVGGLDKVSYPVVIVCSALLGAACLAAGTLPQQPTLALVFLAAAGAAIAMIWPSIMTYAVQSTGKPTTVVFGLVVGIGGSIGASFGAGALGAIKQAGLSYQQSLLTLEIPLVLLIVMYGLMALSQPAVPPQPAQTPAEIEVESESGPL
jgi:MFS family permease